ncbi:hypothetical protein G7Y89_g1845 [Cudoniella acicularis]|uniref:Flavoprotein domain-containing protein n=1 Tax=Cudoniella acicularis TaxID=354080 RepID=A0A8H4RVJ0_9HELO|nr:hypothetical protein G7Y89_g1845 [Cudoniella acicularis]
MLQLIHFEHDVPLNEISGHPPPFVAADHHGDGKIHLLLAASGSVASIKIPNILQALSHHPNLSIRLVLTHSARNFLAGQSAEQPRRDSPRKIKNVEGIFLDEEDANTLAKITGGFSDNLLTNVVRAWDTTGLIESPVENAIKIPEDEWGVCDESVDMHSDQGWFEVLRPQEKELACGNTGDGAMKEWNEIVKVIEKRLRLEQ